VLAARSSPAAETLNQAASLAFFAYFSCFASASPTRFCFDCLLASASPTSLRLRLARFGFDYLALIAFFSTARAALLRLLGFGFLRSSASLSGLGFATSVPYDRSA
jgi:hypothetical protein